MINIKRVYEPASRKDGQRFLIDRLWPRGIKKEELKAKAWIKEVAPSNELRKWFHHDPDKWCEFNRRYFDELDKKPETWTPLLQAARDGDVTLLYSAKDEERNDAVTLRAYLEQKLKTGG